MQNRDPSRSTGVFLKIVIKCEDTPRHLTYRLFPRKIIQIYRTYIHSMKLCREDSFRRWGTFPLPFSLRVTDLLRPKIPWWKKDEHGTRFN